MRKETLRLPPCRLAGEDSKTLSPVNSQNCYSRLTGLEGNAWCLRRRRKVPKPSVARLPPPIIRLLREPCRAGGLAAGPEDDGDFLGGGLAGLYLSRWNGSNSIEAAGLTFG